MEEFLTAFGLTRVDKTKTALYMRGSSEPQHIHITETGEPRFKGLAFNVKSEEDLFLASHIPGASKVEHIDEPGGGSRVRLTEPNGYEIEIVWLDQSPQPNPSICFPVNQGNWPYARVGELAHFSAGPARVKRLGHAVIASTKLRETVEWFRSMLGLVMSDEVYDQAPQKVVMSFNRCDRGDAYVDHHVLGCMSAPVSGLQHLSFEVHALDDVFLGHEHLKSLGKYEHMWGIGRHFLGSQIYDYWGDPWGRLHEHWVDGDRINNKHKPSLLPVKVGFASQWGEMAPKKMIERVSP